MCFLKTAIVLTWLQFDFDLERDQVNFWDHLKFEQLQII